MRWSDIPFNASDRMLRQFAGLCAAALAGVAVWQGVVKDWPSWTWALIALAAACAAAGWLRPRLLKPLFVGWMVLAFPIGWLVSQALLVVLFFGLFLPVALVFRLIGRDALSLRRQKGSHWRPKPGPTDVRQYFRQY